MGVEEVMDRVGERSVKLRESLVKSQSITDNMVSILGSFDHRLSALEAAMRPTQVRTHAIRTAHENIDKVLKNSDEILLQFDLARKAEAKILRGPHEDLEMYMGAIEQMRAIVKFFGQHRYFKSGEGILGHTTNLLTKAISKLEEEFKQMLSNYSKPVEPDRLYDCIPNSSRDAKKNEGTEKGDGNQNKDSEAPAYTPPALIPPRLVPLLQNISKEMTVAGRQQQLFKIYREIRASALEQSLKKLGVEKLSKEEVQKLQWEVLENKISHWNHYMRIAVKLLFTAEKKICDEILDGSGDAKDQCFAEVSATSVSVLCSFGDAVARSKRSPEKLFVLLDMYETMRELGPEIDIIFGGKTFIEMREGARGLAIMLATTILDTFDDFEEAVEKDATKTAVQDGTVHPLTSYVINYVKFLFDYRQTLRQLFQETTPGDPDKHLGSLITKIIQALLNNLEAKSKQYKDGGLTQLFLMNNIHYIVRSVRRSEAKDLLGDDWVQIHRRIVQQHANQYKRVSWAKILQCVTVQGAGGDGNSSANLSKSNIKDKFKTFNNQFEEIHQRQSQWTVPDSELRESLRLAVAEVLLPAYRSFYTRFGPVIDSGRTPSRYVKYSPEDIERMLNDFFENKNDKR